MFNSDVRGIWERRDDETDLQWSRFQLYMEMSPRNVAELARRTKIDKSQLAKMAANKQWRKRAAAYDRWLASERNRQAVAAGVEVFRVTNTADILAEWEKMRLEMFDKRAKMLEKIDAMLDFNVGTSAKTTRRNKRIYNPATKRYEMVVTVETVHDAKWSWGDVAKMVQAVDEIGKELLGLPADVIQLMPELCYQLTRQGQDPAEFIQRAIDALKKAS